MVTIKDIARECGVSIATVSNIFNGKGRVSEEKKREILKKAKELGYVQNTIAKNLKERKTRTIGIITEDLTVFNSAEIVDGIHERLEEENYRFLLGNLRLYKQYGNAFYHMESYKTQLEDEFRMMLSKQVDGIIYVAAHCRRINCFPKDYELPFVLAYSYTERDGQVSVLYDDEQAAYEAVMELFSNGYDRIGIIGGEEKSFHTINREKGARRAFEGQGIYWNDKQCLYGDWSRESGYRICRKLIEQGDNAIFAMNDVMAAGVYDYAAEHELVIGRDIALIGFDNREISKAFHPELTTIELPLHEIGRKAAGEMLLLLKNQNNNTLQYITEKERIEKMQCRLLRRQSVADKNVKM